LRSDAAAGDIRAAAEGVGGHATLYRGGDREGGVFHPLAPALARVHRNLKSEFDPQGIFNPGRLVLDL
jgi:glycolate oxidase FAD binding subunit